MWGGRDVCGWGRVDGLWAGGCGGCVRPRLRYLHDRLAMLLFDLPVQRVRARVGAPRGRGGVGGRGAGRLHKRGHRLRLFAALVLAHHRPDGVVRRHLVHRVHLRLPPPAGLPVSGVPVLAGKTIIGGRLSSVLGGRRATILRGSRHRRLCDVTSHQLQPSTRHTSRVTWQHIIIHTAFLREIIANITLSPY